MYIQRHCRPNHSGVSPPLFFDAIKAYVATCVVSCRVAKKGSQKLQDKCPIFSMMAKAKITPIQKVSLLNCARPLVTTAPPSARGACLMAADQAPLRARSMRLRSSHIFNGVTQNCHAASFHAP